MSDLTTLWAAYARGEYRAVRDVAQRVLREQPRHVDSLQLLAAASFELGDLDTASASYRQLTVLEPDNPEHWINLGTTQREAGQVAEALASLQAAQQRGADSADFHLNLGLLLSDVGEMDAAHQHLTAAAGLDADDPVIALALGNLCCQTVRQQQALAVLMRWRQWRDLSETQLPELASNLLQLGAMSEAEAVLRLALTLDPEHHLATVRLSGLLERLNRLPEAEALLADLPATSLSDRTIHFEQQAVAARLAQRQGRHADAVQGYAALLQLPESAQDAQELQFSLARSLDALGRHTEALAALEAAHSAQLRLLARYTPMAVSQPEPLRIADYPCSAGDIAAWTATAAPDTQRDPVFVVAFPRSGTTLLEQLLDAHPALASMDEQPFLQQAISEMQAAGASYPEGLAALTAAQLTSIRASYWARVAGKVQLAPGQRLVDKNPLNMLRLPAIARLFPDARVILVVRHPCDVLLSCYMQNFRAPEFAVLCRSLAALTEGYCKAFEFWYAQQALLPTPVFELRYEQFVADVPGTARALTEFIGLDWDERLLDPSSHAQRRGYISTPSYAQVVRPVNRDAVDRWRRYGEAFAPLLPQLAPLMTRWGYE